MIGVSQTQSTLSACAQHAHSARHFSNDRKLKKSLSASLRMMLRRGAIAIPISWMALMVSGLSGLSLRITPLILKVYEISSWFCLGILPSQIHGRRCLIIPTHPMKFSCRTLVYVCTCLSFFMLFWVLPCSLCILSCHQPKSKSEERVEPRSSHISFIIQLLLFLGASCHVSIDEGLSVCLLYYTSWNCSCAYSTIFAQRIHKAHISG